MVCCYYWTREGILKKESVLKLTHVSFFTIRKSKVILKKSTPNNRKKNIILMTDRFVYINEDYSFKFAISIDQLNENFVNNTNH